MLADSNRDSFLNLSDEKSPNHQAPPSPLLKKKTLNVNTNTNKGSTFITGVNALGADQNPKMQEVVTYHSRINDTINNLNTKVGSLLKQHENDFFFAYKEQMAIIQRDFRTLKKQLDEDRIRQKEENTIKILSRERDWFREEALKLDKICKDQKKSIDELKFQNNMLTDDKAYFERFVIETKKENMALKKELQLLNKRTQMQSGGQQSEKAPADTESKGTPFETKTTFHTRTGVAKAVSAKALKTREKHEDEEGNLREIEENFEHESKMSETIGHLRNQLERCKREIKQLKVDKTNMQAQRSEYEDFLVVCVDEVKKDIVKRKALIAQQDAATRGQSAADVRRDEPNAELKNFTFQEKKKVIEMILSNEAILDELHTIIFRMGVYDHKAGPRPNSMSNQRSVKMLSSAWRVGLDSQMKEWKYNVGKAKTISMKNLTNKELNHPYNQFTTHSKEVLNQIKGMNVLEDEDLQ